MHRATMRSTYIRPGPTRTFRTPCHPYALLRFHWAMIVPTLDGSGTVVLSVPVSSSKDEMTKSRLYVIDGIDFVATFGCMAALEQVQ